MESQPVIDCVFCHKVDLNRLVRFDREVRSGLLRNDRPPLSWGSAKIRRFMSGPPARRNMTVNMETKLQLLERQGPFPVWVAEKAELIR
jgi:hypothetical protein